MTNEFIYYYFFCNFNDMEILLVPNISVVNLILIKRICSNITIFVFVFCSF